MLCARIVQEGRGVECRDRGCMSVGRFSDSMSGSSKKIRQQQCRDGGCISLGRLCDSMSESCKKGWAVIMS